MRPTDFVLLSLLWLRLWDKAQALAILEKAIAHAQSHLNTQSDALSGFQQLRASLSAP